MTQDRMLRFELNDLLNSKASAQHHYICGKNRNLIHNSIHVLTKKDLGNIYD